jgi:hypothetical protein
LLVIRRHRADRSEESRAARSGFFVPRIQDGAVAHRGDATSGKKKADEPKFVRLVVGQGGVAAPA